MRREPRHHCAARRVVVSSEIADAASGGPPLLSIRDLAVSFDNRGGPRVQAVDGLSLTIYPKQTVAVVGESGSGKSVSAMSVLRLLPTPSARFDRGAVWFGSKLGADWNGTARGGG